MILEGISISGFNINSNKTQDIRHKIQDNDLIIQYLYIICSIIKLITLNL